MRQKLPFGNGHYQIRMILYNDPDYRFPLTSNKIIPVEIYDRLYVELRTEGVDERHMSTVVESCWATPVNVADYPTRWDLITAE